MKTFFGRMKRCIAMLMAVVMVLSASNVGAIAQGTVHAVAHDDAVNTTLSELIVSNYDLSAKEEAIISSGVLSADKGYSYILPPAEVADGGLISVDEETKKITVSAHEDAKGNLWIPVSFDLKNAHGVIAGHDDLPLTNSGNVYEGEYTATDNQFSVEVTYKLEINVSEAEQKELLTAGEKLAADVNVLKLLETANILPTNDPVNALTYAKIQAMVNMALGYQATLTPELVLLFMVADALEGQSVVDVIYGLSQETDTNKISLPGSDTVYELYMSRPQAVAAALRLFQQQETNHNLDFAKFLVDHAADSYLEWLMVHGDEMKETLISNYDDIYYLANNNAGLQHVSDELGYLLEDVAVLMEQLENVDIFDVINQQAQQYGYTIANEQELAAAITQAKATRAQKLGELNTLMGTLGYTEEIKNADDIDGAIAFLETYDPYLALETQINAMLEGKTMMGRPITVSIKNDADINTVRSTISMAQRFGVLTAEQVALANGILDVAQPKALDFVTNRGSYIQLLKDGQSALRTADDMIGKLEQLQASLPVLEQELANKKAEAAEKQAEAEEKKAMLDMLILIMKLLCRTMEPVYNAAKGNTWNTPSVVDTQKAVDYDKLTDWANGLQTTDVTVKENLYVTSSVVRYNMSMYNVSVVVKASMVNPALVDSAETVDLPDYEAPVITLRKGATKQEIMDAIAEINPDAAALAQPLWNGITDANFDRTADVLAEDFELTEDLVYTITYAPKTLTVTYGEGFEAGHGLPTEVPYGYQLTLPAHGDVNSEYVYAVNGTENLDQGTVVLVTENTAISRKEGAMSEKQYLTTLVVKTNPEMDETLKNILLSDAIVKGNSFSIVVPKDEDLQIYFDEATRQVVIKALPVGSRVGDKKWEANTGRLDSTEITLPGGVHSTNESFQMAYVDYKLDLTAAALGVSDKELLNVMNIPYALSTDYKNQTRALDALAAQMPYLKRINNFDTVTTPLGTNTVPELLMSVAALAAAPDSGFLATTPDAARNLAALIRANGYLPLCTVLEGYQANGLFDFYTNEQQYLQTINELHDLLSLVVADAKLMAMLPAEYSVGFKAAQAALELAYKLNDAYAINHDIVIVREDTKTALRRLLNDLADANAQQYTQVPETMTWVQTVSGSSPGNSTITINVSFDGATFTDSTWSVATGSDLDRAELERRIAALTLAAGLTGEIEIHYIRSMTGDSDLVTGPQVINVAWTAKEYPVYVDNQNLGSVTINGGKIQLPAHAIPGFVYEYTIGGDVTRASEYNFSTAKILAMLVDGKITITRTAINMAETELINKANSMGVTLVKDPQRGYIMVLPLDIANVEGSIMPFAMGLFGSGSESIMLGNAPLLYNNQYYLNTLVEALLNTGIDSDRIQTLIDANGNVVSDLTIPAEQIMNDRPAGEQGGTLLKTTLTFDNSVPVGFYVTLVGSGETLKQARDLIATAQKLGIEIAMKDGMVQVIGDLPTSVYAAYVAALTMVGEADVDNVNALNAEVAVGYLVNMLDNALTDDVTNKTVNNTINSTVGKLGLSVNLSESVFNILKNILKNKQVRYDANDESVSYVDLKALPIKSIIDKLQAKVDAMELPAGMAAPQLSSMIAEYNTGLNLTVKADIQNLDKEYVALSVNASALKNKDLNNAVVMLTADELGKVAEGNAVLLLADVGSAEAPVALNLNKSVVLDLNGKTVYGSITANGGRAFVINTDYGTDAYVTGAVSGKNLTILGGKFDADVSAYLKTGYQQVDGVVSNKYVTIIRQGNDVIVTLNAKAAREIATREHLIALALDIVSELAITHYNTAAMTVDGKTIFDLGVDNALGLVTGENRLNALIDTALGWVNAPDLAELVDVLVADATDFKQLKKALETDGLLAAYDFTTAAWNVAVGHNTDKDILDVSVGSGKTLMEGQLKLVLTGDFNGELATLAGALADTTTVTSDFTNVQEVVREGNNILVSGDYAGSVVMDFSKDYKYTVVMSVILAEGNPAIRAKIVDAIEAFYKTDCTNQNKLEICFDQLTVQQLMTALKNHDRSESFQQIAKEIGLSQNTLEQVLQLGNDEMGFGRVVDVAGMVLRKFSPDFNGTLGSLKKTDANGREYYGGDLARDIDKNISAKGYVADIDANITELRAALYLFADHVHVQAQAVEENRVPASCEEDGSYDMVVYCSVCGDELKRTTEVLPATGHSFTNYVSNNDATCFEDGTKTAICDNGCGTTDTIADEGSKLAHSFTNYVSDGNATCLADGTKTAHCDYNCGTTDTIADEGSKLAHSFTNYVSDNNATCEADGTKTAHCDYNCGTTDTIADEGSKLAHSFTNYVSDGNATCLADGTKTATCDNGCGATDTIADEGSKLAHSFTNYVSDGNATCEADGTKTAHCDYNCGTTDTIADEGSKKEHSFTNYVSDGNATCEADGTKTASCDYGCGTTDTIADAGSKKEHSFTNYVSNNDATCLADGTKTATCDYGCGTTDTVTDEGSKLQHSTSLVGYKPADYEVPGYTGDEVCDVCGTVVKQGTEIPALVYEIVVSDSNGNPLYKGADLLLALKAAQNGSTITINAEVTLAESALVDKDITIIGAAKINANGKKIFLIDPAAKITADAALGVFAGVDGYIVVNNANVYTMKQITALIGDASLAGVKVAADETTKYLFLDLEPTKGKTLNALRESLTFADLAGYNVQIAIEGNDGTGLVKTADAMAVIATDASGNVVAVITYTVIVLGDVNCDGRALSNDATATMQIYFGNVDATKPMLLAANINCDGSIAEPVVGAADAQRIMHKYFDWGKTEGGYETALQ